MNADSCSILKYLVDASTLADVTGAAIDARFYRVATFTAQWIGTGTPDGEFYIQGTNENPAEVASPTWYTYYIDENKYTLLTATWAAGVISVDSASAGSLSVTVEPVHPWIRFFFDRTDGGAAAALDVQVHMRDD